MHRHTFREKHHTLLTLKRRKNVVHDVTNVEQHELFGINAGRPLPDGTPKRANSLALVKGVQSRFFQITAAAEAIRHVFQARFEIPVGKGQRIPGKPPGERELVVQEVRTWCLIPLRTNLPSDQPSRSTRRSKAEPITNSRYSFFRDRERSLDPGR